MTDHELIQSTLRRFSRRLRLVRALTAGSRFLVAGLALAVVPLLLKGLLPGNVRWATAGLIAGMTAAGLLYGAFLRARPALVARLADRRLGFKERLTCAVEHLTGEDPDAIIL